MGGAAIYISKGSLRVSALALMALVLMPAFAPASGDTAPTQPAGPGITEKLGNTVKLDEIILRDETGREAPLRAFVNSPTVIGMVYFSCRNICPAIMGGMADVTRRLVKQNQAGGYTMLSISFDNADTPMDAMRAKENYLSAIGGGFPSERWRFLTADAANIERLTGALGFGFVKQGKMYSHAAALMVLSPKGKIIRYIHGATYLPFDLRMALAEAADERVGGVSRKVLLYCFSYDPSARKYTFNILRVAGTLISLLVVGLFIFLVRQERKRSEEIEKPDG